MSLKERSIEGIKQNGTGTKTGKINSRYRKSQTNSKENKQMRYFGGLFAAYDMQESVGVKHLW
jgi:hypothetical protein